MVEVAVREYDVGDVRPGRAFFGECRADRLDASGRTSVNEDDSARVGDHETADLEAHRFGPEHPWEKTGTPVMTGPTIGGACRAIKCPPGPPIGDRFMGSFVVFGTR